MPIYEYECTACGHILEKLQKLDAPPLSQCPQCHAATLQKRVSAAGFRLKGGGWYETDFKTGNKKNVTGGSDASKPAAAKDDKKAAAPEKKSSAE